MTVTADDLDSVISCVMSGLLPITDRDWSVRAGTLEWDCWHTAEHIGDCLMSYVWQLAVQPSHEALLHGNDIAQGFGLSLDPPRDVCRRVLARIFPQAPADLAESDPWTALQWAGGRIELPGYPQQPSWRAHPAP
jgi:hypothetical protein